MYITILYINLAIYVYLFYLLKNNKFYINLNYENLNDFDNLNMNDLNIINCKYPLNDVHITRILVFLLSKDRLYAAYYSLKYWMEINKSIYLKIIIFDHNTTYVPLLKFYKIINRNFNIYIHYLKEYDWKNAVDKEIPNVISNYLKEFRNFEYYILSDIDIILNNIPSNIFDFYGTILNSCKVNVIGPSLMVNDISSKFPDYKKVYKFETHYIKSNHYDILYKKYYYSIILADIDTIFGMRKRTTKFIRQSKLSFRSLSPYIAHHIDWYITNETMPKSFLYYVNHSKSINHSGSAFNITSSLKQP